MCIRDSIECAMMMSVQSQNVCRIVSCIRAAVSESNDDVASSSITIYTTPARSTTTGTKLGTYELWIKGLSIYNCDEVLVGDNAYSYVNELLGHRSLIDHMFVSDTLSKNITSPYQ